jgi:hypothetical protein
MYPLPKEEEQTAESFQQEQANGQTEDRPMSAS